MRFDELYRASRPAISFELFPPRSDAGARDLESRLPRLIDLNPAFLTVTYGAMGTSRDRTLDIAARLLNDYGQHVAHHLTCVGSSESEIDLTLTRIAAAGIQNIVALRGDPPQGRERFEAVAGGYEHAVELVRRIRARGEFGIAVAGYPEKHIEAPSLESDLFHLKQKVDAGADVVITQLFYDNAHYFDFVDRCRETGIEVPVIPGLLPIMDVGQIQRITRMCGSTLPESLLRRLESAPGREAVVRIGVEHAVGQVRELLDRGVDGIHFYVLNRYRHIAEIMKAI